MDAEEYARWILGTIAANDAGTKRPSPCVAGGHKSPAKLFGAHAEDLLDDGEFDVDALLRTLDVA